MTGLKVALVMCVAGLIFGVLIVLEFRQDRRYGTEDAPMEEATARARRRFGLHQRGASGGKAGIRPSAFARVLALALGLSGTYFLGFLVRNWWEQGDHSVSFLGALVFACTVYFVADAFSSYMMRAEIDDDSIALRTLFTHWRVERTDLAGCRWLQCYAGSFGGRYVEQVLFDRHGKAYRIPNLLKERIPHGSWVRYLENLGHLDAP